MLKNHLKAEKKKSPGAYVTAYMMTKIMMPPTHRLRTTPGICLIIRAHAARPIIGVTPKNRMYQATLLSSSIGEGGPGGGDVDGSGSPPQMPSRRSLVPSL